MTYLEEAARQGDLLIVGVNSDESIRRLKGPSRPIIEQADRRLPMRFDRLVRSVHWERVQTWHCCWK